MTKQQGILNDVDLDKIAKLIDLRFELKAKDEIRRLVKDELGNLPSKDEFNKQMSNLLKAVQDKTEEKDTHDARHLDLTSDNIKLKQQVQHLFKTFEIVDPTEVVPSY